MNIVLKTSKSGVKPRNRHTHKYDIVLRMLSGVSWEREILKSFSTLMTKGCTGNLSPYSSIRTYTPI